MTIITTKPEAPVAEDRKALGRLSVQLHNEAWAAAAAAGFAIDISPIFEQGKRQRVIIRAVAGCTIEITVYSAGEVEFAINGMPTWSLGDTPRAHEAFAFVQAHMTTLALLAAVHDEIEEIDRRA